MNIKSEESSSEQYVIISYSHADTEIVKSELQIFDKNGICYWFDESMTGGEEYDKQFFKILDNENCKGIIFFISDAFLLSEPCAGEMKHFHDNYGTGKDDKFCLFVLPERYPYDNADAIYDKVDKYVAEKNDADTRKKLRYLNGHIDLLFKLNLEGKKIYATLGNTNNYIGVYCEEGQLFYNAGIIFGHKQVGNVFFGYFPQKQTRRAGVSDIEKTGEERNADKEPAYYAPIEWIVIKNPEKSQTLLSKDLLFAVDYLSLKYPYKKTGKKIGEYIKEYFLKYFRQGEDKGEIKTIRFLLENELPVLLKKYQRNVNKLREILLPEATYFAQTSNRKNVPAFWLAGDMDDARMVDAATKSLSDQKAGVELYYVRIVIEKIEE
jgi:hypothetical protein